MVNCWEAKGCGRGPGGEKSAELGVCPAASDSACNGINRGEAGGRICWAVAGTLCGGKVQGLFAEKIDSCINCDVFKQIASEEGEDFQMFPGDDPDVTTADDRTCEFEKT
ncbi:MAG: hypothetical protein OEV49_10965 [candidate division Zixibacteria bacterium]|nr:hypothetical protein [candidate division Zixibacteria bacterium]MDH3935822.1 hypothetical protein [candidate division Zixibacteria bacterium]MDH4032846.1 hypothetical protein [candidate division Zixibacteria bacterium]